MNPVKFPESNAKFVAGRGDEDRVSTVHGYTGEHIFPDGSKAPLIITAWEPDEEDLQRLQNGGYIYISMLVDRLPPHMAATVFEVPTAVPAGAAQSPASTPNSSSTGESTPVPDQPHDPSRPEAR